jgi:hypothetical protein
VLAVGLEKLGPSAPPLLDVMSMMRMTGDWTDPAFAASQLEKYNFETLNAELLPEYDIFWTADDIETGPIGKMLQSLICMSWTAEQKETFGSKLLPATGEVLREKHGSAPFAVKWSAVLGVGKKSL